LVVVTFFRALALALALAAPIKASAQVAPDFTEVTRYVDAGWPSLGLPGAALLIAKDGEVVYERYFGAYTPETVVPIASSSKWLSAAVIMTLVDEGKIDLDAKVSRYLPQFVGEKADMTLRQMFSHTSGLVDFPGAWNYGVTMGEYADRVAREGVMAGPPGSGVRYASASMQVVGAIAEKVTGKPWNTLFIERIGKPCGMDSTTYALRPENRNPLLAGGARSSLRDYGRFLGMIAGKGVCGGRRILSEAAIREMQKDQTGALPLLRASNDRMGRASHYGLGQWLDVQAPDGRTIQVSSPGAFGFRPWVNLDRAVYGVFMMQRAPNGPGASAVFDPWTLIDKAHQAVDRAP
jgi:CubicO group peptidase (beta-lactamase class C family)